MSILVAILLGLLQGITEFLPVSSSGHLMLVQQISGLTDVPMFFNIMLHVGTLVAVCVVMRKEVWQLIRHPFSPLMLNLVIATVPTVIIAVIFKLLLPSVFEGSYLGFGFMVTGIALFCMDFLPAGTNALNTMTWKDSLTMGIAQGFGTFPGISRSGITIVGGSLSNLSREALARFSFLMSIPAILGALVLDIKDMDFSALAAGTLGVSWAGIAIGTCVAAISGFFVVKWLLKLITTRSLRPFAYYTFALGFLVVLDMYIFHIFF